MGAMEMPVDSRLIALEASGPRPPKITVAAIWSQFWTDIMGKEVQSAETTSHSWVANQFGHVCLGLLLGGTLPVVVRAPGKIFAWLCFPISWLDIAFPWDSIVGTAVAAFSVCYWEWRAYRIAATNATGPFPVERTLLAKNAVIAALYMLLGIMAAFAFRHLVLIDGEWLGWPHLVWAGILASLLVVVGCVSALPWLRQKIIWQKAALPYLFRLAHAPHTMAEEDARRLLKLIDDDPPPSGMPRQMVIGGPIGSGRTSFGTGIGTEFAFRKAMVRYLSLATLLECAARVPSPHFADDTGPENLLYWRWSESQVLIIDDIGPLLAAKAEKHEDNLERFRQLLTDHLGPIRPVLERCHTVWVIGDLREEGRAMTDDEALNQFANVIRDFCGKEKGQIFAIQLENLVSPLSDGPAEAMVWTPMARTRYV